MARLKSADEAADAAVPLPLPLLPYSECSCGGSNRIDLQPQRPLDEAASCACTWLVAAALVPSR
jgi:hypothetical protein